MPTEHLTDELLQRYRDGDLDASACAHTEQHLTECGSCSAQSAALERLHELLRAASKDAARDLDSAALFASIERGLQAEVPAGKVIALRSRRIRSVTASAVAALAVAAAVLITVWRPGAATRPEAPSESTSLPTSKGTPEARPSASRSEVVTVDFGSNAGTVFEISLSDGSSTPVVWINDDE